MQTRSHLVYGNLWRWVGEKCREEMPSAGIIALHKWTLCLASSLCIFHQLNAGSNCSKGRNSLCSVQLNITFLEGSWGLTAPPQHLLAAPAHWRAGRHCCSRQIQGCSKGGCSQIQSIPAHLSGLASSEFQVWGVAGFCFVFKEVWSTESFRVIFQLVCSLFIQETWLRSALSFAYWNASVSLLMGRKKSSGPNFWQSFGFCSLVNGSSGQCFFPLEHEYS